MGRTASPNLPSWVFQGHLWRRALSAQLTRSCACSQHHHIRTPRRRSVTKHRLGRGHVLEQPCRGGWELLPFARARCASRRPAGLPRRGAVGGVRDERARLRWRRARARAPAPALSSRTRTAVAAAAAVPAGGSERRAALRGTEALRESAAAAAWRSWLSAQLASRRAVRSEPGARGRRRQPEACGLGLSAAAGSSTPRSRPEGPTRRHHERGGVRAQLADAHLPGHRGG